MCIYMYKVNMFYSSQLLLHWQFHDISAFNGIMMKFRISKIALCATVCARNKHNTEEKRPHSQLEKPCSLLKIPDHNLSLYTTQSENVAIYVAFYNLVVFCRGAHVCVIAFRDICLRSWAWCC